MILVELFLAFLQIGATAFGGGYAALPLIQQVIVNDHQWLTMTEMVDVVTISQMTPGPIAINAASFVGAKIFGLTGSVVATFGTVVPQTTLMLILGYFMFGGKKIGFLDKMLKGLRPGIVGLIATAALSMTISSVLPTGLLSEIDFIALVAFIVGIILYLRKFDMIKLIGLGAIIGIVLGFIGTII